MFLQQDPRATMEESGCMSKSNGPKDHKNERRATKETIISYGKAPVDSCWKSKANFDDGGDLLGDFPWPPRSYTCTFCKREFRSAQALGGHMNVHRREKAKLRQITFLPSCLHLDQNPNPKILTTFASNTSVFPSMFRSSPYSSSLAFSAPRFSKSCPSESTAMRSQKSNRTVDHGFDVFSHEKESLIVKKSENGSLVDSKIVHLDLELRLGYS